MGEMTLLEARDTIGGPLGDTSKMPGYSYSLPAVACKVGSMLRKDPNSPCAKCYAMKGRYLFANVKAAMQRRLTAISHPKWVEAMVYVINHYVKRDVPFFRWHDSGDIQSAEHLNKIVEIAIQLPWVNFWLPTQERELVYALEYIPDNLTIRISNKAKGDQVEVHDFPTSGVVKPTQPWESLVELNTKRYWACPSSLQENTCGECRACWNRNIQHVIYKEH